MSAKSVFRLTTQTPKYKDPLLNATFPQQRPTMNHEDSVFMNLDAPVVRNSPHFLWQSLTPELRAEALRRAHLIHLLRQVNPNLQLCRKSTGQIQITTAEKGIQVPDIRYDLAGNRRFSTRPPDLKRSASFTAPGVRIQPRAPAPLQQPPPPPPLSHPPPPLSTHPTQNYRQPTNVRTPVIPTYPRQNPLKQSTTSLNIPRQNQNRPSYSSKDTTIEVTLKTIPKTNEDKSTGEKQPHETVDSSGRKPDIKETQEVTTLDTKPKDEDGSVVVVEDENDEKSSEKTERQVVVKSKDASSGDEDSVVVVLNQPRSEQGLERKYGQFFCRRCLRGWSSRSVWCVRHTCKVYIKQTCNICNKLVNPYLVCRVPPANTTTRKDRK